MYRIINRFDRFASCFFEKKKVYICKQFVSNKDFSPLRDGYGRRECHLERECATYTRKMIRGGLLPENYPPYLLPMLQPQVVLEVFFLVQ